MENKIYKVIKKSIYMEAGESSVSVKVFEDEKLAREYLKKEIIHAKQDVEDLTDYCVEEDENSYERYLDGYASQDSIAIWLEEDVICKELEKDKELENDYDI